MIRFYKRWAVWCGILALTWCGCDNSDLVQPQTAEGVLAVRLATRSMLDGETSDAESQVNTLRGYRFEDGALCEVFESLPTDGEGICHIRPSRMEGEVYFLANAAKALEGNTLQPGVSTLDDFLRLEATAESMTAEGILMTGRLVLEAGMPTLASATLERSVARIDLDVSYEGVEVQRVCIKDIVEKGYVNASEQVGHPIEAKSIDLVKTFEDVPFTNRKSTLFYVAEQNAQTHDVEVEAIIDGAWHRLKTKLPAVRHNTVYTLKVYGKGSEARVEVLSEEWESGLSSESVLQSKGWIDREASRFSEGVTVNEAGDTVYVSHEKSEAGLVIQVEEGVSLQVEGRVGGATVVSYQAARQSTISVEVSSLSRPLGTVQEYVYLNLYKQQAQIGRIVLSFAPNPIHMDGILKFDTDGVCDFGRYVDGRLATFTLGDGQVMRLEIASSEAPWLRLDAGQQANTYHLEGGWKPNDPTADGRVQTAKLIISDTDGKHAETYVVKRRNWGLPVVNINGVWWCKYNLRGNVKDFSAQILPKDDPAVKAGSSVADYLKTCSDEEFLAILGDQYQGGNPQGLPLSYDGSQFYYEGFQSSVEAVDDFGMLDATVMAPDGYEVPGYDDFRFFAWGNDCALGYGSNGFNNKLGQRLNYTITERVANFKGGVYGPVNIYDFDYDGSHWVMCGLGHQWNTAAGSLSKMVILMATSGQPGKTWMLESYPADSPQGRATWIKYAGQNQQKTRAIRCVKTPVNYIYE